MLSFSGIVLGVALLIAGGTLLVRGASKIAADLGVSPMVVGLTIVGFGTSSPELVVNVFGALKGESGLAFGNVVGSNISNLGLILGAAAVMAPITIQSDLVRRELPLLLLVTTMMAVLALDGLLEGRPPEIGRSDSVILLLMFCIFLYFIALDLTRARHKDILFAEIRESTVVITPPAGRWQWLLVLAGFVLLFAGGELTIRNGVALAGQLGVSTAIVGLFVVAVGTSMPELVTSVIAATRREADLALGNVIGSNIFNSLMVLPAGGLITPIAVPQGGIADVVVSWLLAAAIVPIFFIGKALLGRITGVVFIAAYLTYALTRVIVAA